MGGVHPINEKTAGGGECGGCGVKNQIYHKFYILKIICLVAYFWSGSGGNWEVLAKVVNDARWTPRYNFKSVQGVIVF